MNKNDLIELEIFDIGTDGEGVGKTDGFTIFVNNAVPGDVIEARLLKVKKNYGYGKIERIITPSPDRVDPKCPVAGKCGGCSLQFLSYPAQLKYKEKKVFDCLTRIGGVDPDFLKSIFEPGIGMEYPWHYRNKAQYPVGKDREGNLLIGFYSFHSHRIVENDECCIENPVSSFIIRGIRKVIIRFNISLYDEMTGKGVLRHCLIRSGFSTGEVMVCLVLNASDKELKKWDKDGEIVKAFVEGTKKAIEEFNRSKTVCGDGGCSPISDGMSSEMYSNLKTGTDQKVPDYKLVSFSVNINRENTNVILGQKLIPLYGEPYITDKIGDVSFRISPMSFYQVNPVQTKKLYDKALEYALSDGNDLGTVWDLYCGIGTISLFLARHAKKVYGVEIVPEAIENAKENAKLNDISNAEFFVGAAEDVVEKLYPKLINSERPDVIVVDPPRKGCDESLLNTLITMSPKKIVYVSCDPATLARDIKFLLGNGYELKKVCPCDQFEQSFHIECVCELSRG